MRRRILREEKNNIKFIFKWRDVKWSGDKNGITCDVNEMVLIIEQMKNTNKSKQLLIQKSKSNANLLIILLSLSIS